MTGRTNAEQARRWNGESGRNWIAHRERHVAGHQRLVPHLFAAAGISPEDRVLDVGCGCGGTTIAAARMARSALGLDLSGPMLQVARRLADEAGVANVADVMGYVRSMRMVQYLTAEMGDDSLAEQALAEIAGQYAARQRADGVWVRAAAWLTTARRGQTGTAAPFTRPDPGLARNT